MAYINLKAKHMPESNSSWSGYNVVGVSEDYAVIPEDDYVGVMSGNPVTITLPLGHAGRHIIVKNEMGVGSGVITVVGTNEEMIDSQSSFEISEPVESASFIFRAGGWHVI